MVFMVWYDDPLLHYCIEQQGGAGYVACDIQHLSKIISVITFQWGRYMHREGKLDYMCMLLITVCM